VIVLLFLIGGTEFIITYRPV